MTLDAIGTEFDPARARLKRARDHGASMASVWNDYLEPHPFEFRLVPASPREHLIEIVQHEPVPTELSVLFGEWLYNLRSSLDYIVIAAATYANGRLQERDEQSLQYPIYDDPDTWKRNLYRLRPLLEHQRQMLWIMQPFNTDDPDANFLGWINRLARIDRHRRLSVSTARVATARPVFEFAEAAFASVGTTLEWGEFTFRNGRCRLARLRLELDGPGPRRVNPRVGIDPEVEEWARSPFWSGVRFSERIHMMQVFVEMELSVYEQDCLGRTPGGNVLAPGFLAESVQRHKDGLWPRLEPPTERPVTWSLPEAARVSTGAAMEDVARTSRRDHRN